MSDLQLALIGVGTALVAAVVAYNKWQERKHRKLAEQAFRTEHADVLLGTADADQADREPATPRRIEPVEMAREPAVDGPPVVAEEPPTALADERIDCVVRFESAEAIGGGYLWQAQGQSFAKLARPVRWLGLDEKRGDWVPLSAHNASGFRRLRAALQVADRRGAVTDAELSLFFNGVQRLADEFLAVADMPTRSEVLARAEELDRFCAGVDVQIGVNIVSRDGHVFAGTKLRGLAEAAGLGLKADGLFHGADEEGQTLFTLGNLEPALFAADEMKTLATHGLTLTLDVPRVAEGAATFDHMIALARQLAESLDGLLVDDNRAPLADSALAMIRKSIAQFQDEMQRYGVPAGGPLALRLFA